MGDMPFEEQKFNAANWWDRMGRKLLVHQFKGNITKEKDRVTAGGRIKVEGDKTPEIRTGISLGLPWDQLTGEEQLKVTKAWHDEIHKGKEEGLVI